MKSPAVQTIKWTLIILLLVCSYLANAGQKYKLFKEKNKRGQTLVWIENYTNKTLYCQIKTKNKYDHIDFHIKPRKKSDKYFEPRTKYIGICK